MSDIRKKLGALSNGKAGRATEKLVQRREKRTWSKRSALIGLRILSVLREKNMSQRELAAIMSVTPQQISKYVKGSENLTLDTIAKLEAALGQSLIDVIRTEKKHAAYQRIDGKEFRSVKPLAVITKYINMHADIHYSSMEFHLDERKA